MKSLVWSHLRFALVAMSGAANFAAAQNPALSRVQLASGSFNTDAALVSMTLTTSGEPTAYRASESRDFAGAVWHSLASNPSFTLSGSPGAKVVYVQVGKQAPLPAGLTSVQKTTTSAISPLPGDLVLTPAYVSNIVADTIILGLPDLRTKIELASSIKDNSSFDFWVTVSNAGQATPPRDVIHLYNSFVVNSVVFDRFEVPFGAGRLVGDGCKVTDVSTIECWLAPIPPGGGTGLHVFGHTVRAVAAGQVSTTVKLRTRIEGIRESSTTNNWVDTPLVILK